MFDNSEAIVLGMPSVWQRNHSFAVTVIWVPSFASCGPGGGNEGHQSHGPHSRLPLLSVRSSLPERTTYNDIQG
jgi:hypothetical protein